MLELIKPIYDLLLPIVKLNRAEKLGERKRFFVTLVAPSFALLENVHRDYVKNFTKLQNTFERQEWPTFDTVLWLREASAEFMVERDRLKKFDRNLENFENFFRRPRALDHDRAALSQAFTEYCHAIMMYFHSGFWVASSSWYSEFLSSLAQCVHRFDGDFEMLCKHGRISADLDRNELLKKLKAGTFPDELVQETFDNETIFNIDLQSGYTLDAKRFGEIIVELRQRFAEAAEKYERLASLCAYQ